MQENFRSLGFSTFVFASLGALSSIEFRLMPKEFHGLQRRFAPLFGALLLAVFMGLGENSDIFAHGYGFILGLVVGFLPKRKSLQWGITFSYLDVIMIITYFTVFLCCWLLALFY
jgi:rhomboid protease GluP